ncbi:polysaccharide deacetylase family protein [Labilibaculum euxinus]
MISLCLTLDYELFGSGRGDVFKHIIEPTNRMLGICEQRKIKLTIFFEVVEYWKLKEAYESGTSMGYSSNPATAMKEQIQRAYQLGHDVQLHLHPQWIDAKYEKGEWLLNLDYWRLPEVPDQPNETISMGLPELIRKGKETLESILQVVNPEYKCNILRAGGYNIDPSDRLLKVLKQHSFIADSSVYFGGKAEGNLSKYDYSNISETKAYWYASNNSLTSSNGISSGFLELPIFAQKRRRILKYDAVRIKSAMQNKANSLEKFKNNSAKKSKWETVQFLLQEEALTWDFCLFSKGKMRNFLKAAIRLQEHSAMLFHPFILVGHPKDFYYPDALLYLAKQAGKREIAFHTLSELQKKIKQQ